MARQIPDGSSVFFAPCAAMAANRELHVRLSIFVIQTFGGEGDSFQRRAVGLLARAWNLRTESRNLRLAAKKLRTFAASAWVILAASPPKSRESASPKKLILPNNFLAQFVVPA